MGLAPGLYVQGLVACAVDRHILAPMGQKPPHSQDFGNINPTFGRKYLASINDEIKIAFKICVLISYRIRDSSVGTVAGYRLHDPEVGVRVPVTEGSFSRKEGQSCSGVKKATRLQLVLRSRKRVTVHPPYDVTAWCLVT
jgi:hypothetical protein